MTVDFTRDDDSAGTLHVTSIQWELRGPVRSVLRVDGHLPAGGGRNVDVRLRLHVHTAIPGIRFELALTNPAKAEHAGGFWELGDPGSILFRDCSVRTSVGTPATLEGTLVSGDAMDSLALPFSLYQDSSGGANWQSRVHVNRNGEVPLAFCGYHVRTGDTSRTGTRATPSVRVTSERGVTELAVRHFWQNAPKALEVADGQLTLRLFPKQFADLHELQGGERKTHDFFVGFAADRVSATPLDWVREPAMAVIDPEWYAAADAVPYLTPASRDTNEAYRGLVNSIVDGPESFAARREVIDEFGWRNFGDIYADHEGAFTQGQHPVVSHYNNQYRRDLRIRHPVPANGGRPMVGGAAGTRLARPRYRHLSHEERPRKIQRWAVLAYGSLRRCRPLHTPCYPKAPGVSGGGPSNEHAYPTGLMLHYFMSGQTASRDAAIELAEWILRMEDPNSTPFGCIWRNPTGMASSTVFNRLSKARTRSGKRHRGSAERLSADWTTRVPADGRAANSPLHSPV